MVALLYVEKDGRKLWGRLGSDLCPRLQNLRAHMNARCIRTRYLRFLLRGELTDLQTSDTWLCALRAQIVEHYRRLPWYDFYTRADVADDFVELLLADCYRNNQLTGVSFLDWHGIV